MLRRRPVVTGVCLLAIGGYVVTTGTTFLPVLVGSVTALAGIHGVFYGFLQTDFGRLGYCTLGLGAAALPAVAVLAGIGPGAVIGRPALETAAATVVYTAGIAFVVLLMRMLRISGGQHDTDLVTAADLEDGPDRR